MGVQDVWRGAVLSAPPAVSLFRVPRRRTLHAARVLFTFDLHDPKHRPSLRCRLELVHSPAELQCCHMFSLPQVMQIPSAPFHDEHSNVRRSEYFLFGEQRRATPLCLIVLALVTLPVI